MGVAPLTIRLPPGTYSIETGGDGASGGSARILVDRSPVRVDVRPGDSLVKGLGVAFEGLGILSIVLGVVAAVTFSRNDAGYARWAIAVPLLLGGAASFGVGLGLNIAGATTVSVPSPSARGLGAGVFIRF